MIKTRLEITINNVLDTKETRLELRLNNVLDTKETFFDCKRKISKSPKNRMFSKGLTHAFGQKMPILSLFVFGQNKTINKV